MTDRRVLGDRRWRWVGGVALLLGLAALVPGPSRGGSSGADGSDKFLHLLGHAALTAALFGALDGTVAGGSDRRRSVRIAATAVVASTLYGACTERVQRWSSGRRFEWGDLAAALVGSVAAAGLSLLRGRSGTSDEPVIRAPRSAVEH